MHEFNIFRIRKCNWNFDFPKQKPVRRSLPGSENNSNHLCSSTEWPAEGEQDDKTRGLAKAEEWLFFKFTQNQLGNMIPNLGSEKRANTVLT